MSLRIIPKEVADQIKEYIFSQMEKPIELTALIGGQYGEDLKNLLKDLEEISEGKLKIEYVEDKNKIKEYVEKYDLKIDNCGNRDSPILFYKDKPNVIDLGSPFDQEFTAFLEDLLEISNGVKVSKKVEDYIKNIDREIDILIFITPSCPHCPYMVKYAHTFALLNPKIRGIMIEAYEFPEISDCYNVQAVPRNIILDRKTKEVLLDFEGRIPIVNFAEYVYKATKGEKVDLPF